MEERLQKIIASAGLSSRRKAEELILNGRVRVNGQIVRELGSRADPERDRIEVDGESIYQPERVYYMLHKPPQFITTLEDPEGRPHVGELIRRIRERVVPVGRLDWDSEGLLVLTNDGDAVYKMTHPKYGVLKTYHVKVKGVPTEDQVELLRRGVTIDGRRTGTNQVEWVRNTRGDINSWWRVTINEGINRQVRKMFDRIEHPVQKLIRVKEGELDLGELPRGAYRELTPSEVRYVQNLGKYAMPGEGIFEKAVAKLSAARPKPAPKAARGEGRAEGRGPSRAEGRGTGRAAGAKSAPRRGERSAPRPKGPPKIGKGKRTTLAKVRPKSKKK